MVEYRFNKDLIDGTDESRLGQIGFYLLIAYKSTTVVQSLFVSNDVNEQLINSLLPVTSGNMFSVVGIHQTIANKDTPDSVDLQQSLDRLSTSIKNNYRIDKDVKEYILSFTTVTETEQEIKRSPITLYLVDKDTITSTKSMDQLKMVSDVVTVDQNQIRADIYKSNYLVSVSTSTSIPLTRLQSYLSNSNGGVYFTTPEKSIITSATSLKDIIKPTKRDDSSIVYPDVNITVLFKITSNITTATSSAPSVSVEKGISLINETPQLDNSICVSTLCILDKETKSQDVITLFKQAIQTQIQGQQQSCKAFHFQLSFLPYPITTIYSKTSDGKVDDSLTYSQRKQYHETLGLSLTKAFLKTSLSDDLNAKPTSSSSNNKKQSNNNTTHIINVHNNLDLNTKTDGTVYLVQGDYEYYHYLQDNMDDNGWGCAYRSMQTICSWLKLQNFTKKSVPTHLDIQKILVELQDKEQSFIKSKQWIGAFEITLCLDYLYNIECKILNVSTGADVIYKSRELAKHFQVNGCPIMIGGGVLAYTLLGIDFNESTGETRYLILDPHYTGATDNIKLIKEKGWCGWKPASLFRKDAFYNFCMPQIKNDL